MESDPEFKKSLADEEIDGGFKHKIDEENAEDLLEDASHSGYDNKKEDEDIILRLNELIVESDPEFQKEKEDQHEDLNAHRSLADEEIDGGFKHRIEEGDSSHSRYNIKKDPTLDDIEKSNRSNLAESQEAKTRKRKLEEKEEIDLSDSGLGTIEVLEEIVLEYQELIEYAKEMMKDEEKEKKKKGAELEVKLWGVLFQLTSSLNKGYRRVKNEVQCLKKKNKNETEESYLNKRPYITVIFSRLEGVNATFYDCIGKELSICEDKLNGCNGELEKFLFRIRKLKADKIIKQSTTEMHKKMEDLKMEEDEGEAEKSMVDW